MSVIILRIFVAYIWSIKISPESLIVVEENGVYDLQDIEDFKETVIILPQGETYYPNALLSPEDLKGGSPSNTEGFVKTRPNYLTQHFLLQVPKDSSVYNMTFTLSGRHAMRVYVNGEIAGETGHVGPTKKDTVVWENNITFQSTPIEGFIDIVLQSSQFYHFKRGASLADLRVTKARSLSDPFLIDRLKGLVFSGILLFGAILMICIYLFMSHTLPTFYFALACIVMSLRECLQSQAWIYFPIPGNVSFMLEYLSVALLTIFLTIYISQFSSGIFLKIVEYTAITGSSIYGLCTLFADSIFYTSILKYYQILLVLCIVPGIIVLFWKMRRLEEEEGVAVFGITIFYIAAISDIVMYSNVFGEYANIPISEASMLAFALAQTVYLLRMNSRKLNESKLVEQKLEAENHVLERLSRLKNEFLSNVSHELKTPLAVISGHAQLLSDEFTDSEHAAALDKSRIISSEVDRLALMVGQVLDISRIEEGNMMLDKKPCHIDELIYRAVETHFSILNKGKNILEIKAAFDLPQVNIDQNRIGQVLVNLLANALRHTKEGTIIIGAEEGEDFIEVSVSDTGAGILAEDIPKLFNRFSSGKGGTGTGLGLYISKYIVEEHGGRIWIESSKGEGTRVAFTLPTV